MAAENESELHLSLNDESVLHRVFTPHLPFDATQCGLQEPSGEHHCNGHAANGHINEEEDTREVRESRELEKRGVESANSGNHKQAVALFTSAINIAPHRSSAYNNRAQAYRLLHNVEGAVSDLDKAVELSEGRGPAACQAFTQRALIRKLQGNEEGALEDFRRAAALGGQFAKAQVIAMNPYAAMCGAAVAEMLQRERGLTE